MKILHILLLCLLSKLYNTKEFNYYNYDECNFKILV